MKGQVEDKEAYLSQLGLGVVGETGTNCCSSPMKFWDLDLILYE